MTQDEEYIYPASYKIELDGIDFMFLYGFLQGSLPTVKKMNNHAYNRIRIILERIQPIYDEYKNDPAN